MHSHGPALTGEELKAQISSYTGGCETFLGNQYGIAQGPQDVPMAPHECSTIAGFRLSTVTMRGRPAAGRPLREEQA